MEKKDREETDDDSKKKKNDLKMEQDKTKECNHSVLGAPSYNVDDVKMGGSMDQFNQSGNEGKGKDVACSGYDSGEVKRSKSQEIKKQMVDVKNNVDIGKITGSSSGSSCKLEREDLEVIMQEISELVRKMMDQFNQSAVEGKGKNAAVSGCDSGEVKRSTSQELKKQMADVKNTVDLGTITGSDSGSSRKLEREDRDVIKREITEVERKTDGVVVVRKRVIEISGQGNLPDVLCRKNVTENRNNKKKMMMEMMAELMKGKDDKAIQQHITSVLRHRGVIKDAYSYRHDVKVDPFNPSGESSRGIRSETEGNGKDGVVDREENQELKKQSGDEMNDAGNTTTESDSSDDLLDKEED